MKREEKMKVNTASIPPCSPPLCPSCLSVCLPCTQGLFMESNVTHATPSDSSLPGLLTAHTSLTFSTTPACTCMRAHTHTQNMTRCQSNKKKQAVLKLYVWKHQVCYRQRVRGNLCSMLTALSMFNYTHKGLIK